MSGKNVNWIEGQFIHPHHFQQAFLEVGDQAAAALTDFVPHAYGISRLEISESDCENNNFLISEIDCRLPSGIRLTYPGNAVIASRDFRQALDANKGYLNVYLALPHLSEEEPNCLRFDEQPLGGQKYRFVSLMEKVKDLASGGNPREIEVKRFNPKILFEGESTHGYEVLPIAVVARSAQYGAVPKLDRDYVPPCIDMGASSRLAHFRREIGNRLIAKNRILRAYWKSQAVASAMKARDGFKVQALAVATNSFAQYAAANRIHPFMLYCKIAEIIGMLSIYCAEERYNTLPAYDHDDLGTCFATAHDNLVKLLSLLEEVTYTSRVFEPADDLLVCPLEPAWLEDRFDAYICFESSLREEEVETRVNALKIASQNVIPVLNKRRIRGMSLEGPVHHLDRLPASPTNHFFKIPRDTTFFPKLKEHKVLAIWGKHDWAELVTLYLLERT